MGSFRLAAGTGHLHPECNFAESLVETVRMLLCHSCRSELTRQGISLGSSHIISERAGLYLEQLSRPSKGRRQSNLDIKSLRVPSSLAAWSLPCGLSPCPSDSYCRLNRRVPSGFGGVSRKWSSFTKASVVNLRTVRIVTSPRVIRDSRRTRSFLPRSACRHAVRTVSSTSARRV